MAKTPSTVPFWINVSRVSTVVTVSFVVGWPMMYCANICERPASKPVSLPVAGSSSENNGPESVPPVRSVPRLLMALAQALADTVAASAFGAPAMTLSYVAGSISPVPEPVIRAAGADPAGADPDAEEEPAADPGAAEEPEGMTAVDDAPACAEVTTEAGELGDAVLDELQAAKEIVVVTASRPPIKRDL